MKLDLSYMMLDISRIKLDMSYLKLNIVREEFPTADFQFRIRNVVRGLLQT
jgi:hypothetical protein